jgi:hypothetical protein
MHDAVADGGDVFRMEGEGVAEQRVLPASPGTGRELERGVPMVF